MQFSEVELVESCATPALVTDTNGNVLAANKAALRAAQSPGFKRLTDVIHGDADKVLHYLQLCARTREPLPGAMTWQATNQNLNCEGTLLRPRSDAEPAILFLKFNSKDDASQNFILLNEKIAALSREIADRKRAEAERDELIQSERAARSEAERVSRMKDEFLATLSHELRTPLNAILGWAQILRMTKPSEEEFRQAVDTIERNTRIQTQLIDDLLDMSRIISGKVRLEVQRVDLATVIEAAAESVRPAFDARQIRLQTVMDSIGRVVAGDINRLQQVFWNLLSNAAKFTPKGGRVQVVLERVNSHIEVSVIDTGAGIKPEFLPHVFERFQQADSSSTRGHGGLGLGLAIVRHLVELHGGSVRAKSPGEGKGSTFIVSLPLTIMHADEAPEAREHPTMSGATENEPDCPPALQGVRVLVVDDEVDALQIVKRVLEICGCIVLTAGSAEEAFQLVQRESPQVLISDIGMPGQDGFELLKRVRALSPEKGGRIPAIALTAFARTDDRRKAMMAGFQLHMAKPVESAELIAAVANVAGLTGYS